ncbi:MAG: leucyl aminopeptidase, partial [Thermoprotei archaeon]
NSREAGSIVGGLFLKNFVEKAKWAHIDLAGPAINPKEWEWMPKGGTGFGVRLLVNYLENISES